MKSIKTKKYESLKRTLKRNPEYYQRMKEKYRITNSRKYISTSKIPPETT